MSALTLPYTAAEALQQVRVLINETTASFWTDEEINNWIIEGVIDVSSRGVSWEKRDSINLAANTIAYTALVSGGAGAIAKIVKVYACVFDNGSNDYKGLQQIHPRMIKHLTAKDAGEPLYFWHFGTEIGVWPLTTTAVASAGVIQVFFSQISYAITDLPDYYQSLPILYAAAKAKMKDQKYAAANQLFAIYLNALAFQRTDLYERGADSNDMLKTPDRTQIVAR